VRLLNSRKKQRTRILKYFIPLKNKQFHKIKHKYQIANLIEEKFLVATGAHCKEAESDILKQRKAIKSTLKPKKLLKTCFCFYQQRSTEQNERIKKFYLYILDDTKTKHVYVRDC